MPTMAIREQFHVIHKVPSGDGPYVRAKHAQLAHKDPESAIVLFWKAINAGDRVDSALKDIAVVMKRLDRTEEAIEAIKSFRVLCSKQAQGSLDNILIDLYKKCARVDEQIELLRQKLSLIYHGEAFNSEVNRDREVTWQEVSRLYQARNFKNTGKLGMGLYAESELHGSRSRVSKSSNYRSGCK